MNGTSARLTPAMRGVLWAVGAVVVVLSGLAVWLLNTDFGVDAAPAQSPSSVAAIGPLPSASPTAGSEVPDPTPALSGPNRIPPLAPAELLVAPPFSDPSSTNGALSEGYPADVMGPAPDSDVVSSAISSEGDTMQVTLVARTDSAADAVIAHYRDLWSGLQLTEQAASAQDGVSYAGRGATLTLAFSSGSGTGTVYTLLATFRTG